MLFRYGIRQPVLSIYAAKTSQYIISHGEQVQKRRFTCSLLLIGFCCICFHNRSLAVRIIVIPYPFSIDSIDTVNTQSFVNRTVPYIPPPLGIEEESYRLASRLWTG